MAEVYEREAILERVHQEKLKGLIYEQKRLEELAPPMRPRANSQRMSGSQFTFAPESERREEGGYGLPMTEYYRLRR